MKTTISNRKNQKIVILLELNNNHKGLAFVMHGLGGFKEEPHVRVMSQALLEKGFSVVSFDTTNTFGESNGTFENATTTNYYEDLIDVINWAKKQEWYKEPYFLVGRSLGGFCTALYAENHPEEIKALAPISTMVSGKLSFEAYPKDQLKKWEKTGWLIEKSRSKPGITKKLKWNNMMDRMKYDLLEKVDKLTMPVLMIVGEKDVPTPVEHQNLLFEKLPGKKEIHIIKGSPHTFRKKEHLDEVKKIFLEWIDKL
ncbi:lysophospholipase [Candidatus Woesearchaeota archaeon]|nr:lysophospholipase [Candidatus Woesearchaeota archaeon]